jgi:RNA polymerase sigma-70 factor (ECF subfamily)
VKWLLVMAITVGMDEAELCRSFAPRIRLYGLRHLRDEAAAEDLVQQVLVVVIESLRAGKVRDVDQLASYVLGTSRLIARGLQGGARRQQRLLDQQGLVEPEGREPPEPLDTERLRACLEALPTRERTLVVLTFYAEQSGDEIAAALGITPGNVRVVRHRAVARLQQCMGADEVRS